MNVLARQVVLGLVFQAAVVTAIGGGILLLRLFIGGAAEPGGVWLRGTGIALQLQGIALLALTAWCRPDVPQWGRPAGLYVGVAALILGSLFHLLIAA